MSNILTLKEELKADLHSLVDDTTVYRKIIGAMRFHRDKRLWFSERTATFTLTAGKDEYALGDGPPIGLMEVVGEEIQVLVGGSLDQVQSCWRVPSRELDSRRFAGTQQSTPLVWDFWAKKMRFYPIPDSSTDQVRFRYVSDIGVPEVRYDSGASAFKFYTPGGVIQMTTTDLDNFANDWTDYKGAFHLIKSRAAYLLYKETLRDGEAAENWLAQWLEQVAQLEGETEKKTAGATSIQGTILGDDDDYDVFG